MTFTDATAPRGGDADPRVQLEQYGAMTPRGRLRVLTELAALPDYQELALTTYQGDNTLPDIEQWLYELGRDVRSTLVALLHQTGHEFVRAVFTAHGLHRAQEKLARDRQRLDEMKEDKNDSYTASGDTWHDNPGWKDLEQAVQRLERDIRQLEVALRDGLVCDIAPLVAGRRVTIGSAVTYRQVPLRSGDSAGFSISAHIVGMFEQDPDEDRYSYQSPVAQALRGLEAGETRRYELPAGWFEFTIETLDV
jgi:transcription elongation GreA/GreB family factor